MSTWWRRNRWGVFGLVPALAIGLAVPIHTFYTDWWRASPRTAVPVEAGHAVSFDRASIQLRSFDAALHLTDFMDEPLKVPPGAKVWEGVVHFSTESPDKVLSCHLYLEDAGGSTYEANPTELNDLRLNMDLPSCTPPLDDKGSPERQWSLSIFFITPAKIRPAAVEIVTDGALPRYARFSLPQSPG